MGRSFGITGERSGLGLGHRTAQTERSGRRAPRCSRSSSAWWSQARVFAFPFIISNDHDITPNSGARSGFGALGTLGRGLRVRSLERIVVGRVELVDPKGEIHVLDGVGERVLGSLAVALLLDGALADHINLKSGASSSSILLQKRSLALGSRVLGEKTLETTDRSIQNVAGVGWVALMMKSHQREADADHCSVRALMEC